MKFPIWSLGLVLSMAACDRTFDMNMSMDSAGSAENSNSSPSPGSAPNTDTGDKLADPAAEPAPKVICGALGNKSKSQGNGLIASLYYAANEKQGKTLVNSGDYIREGIQANATLLLGDLNVPTQAFSAGFRYGPGADDFLRTNDGTKLFEWFAIHAFSNLQLMASQPEGAYQFATITDDGSSVYLDGQTLISNEGQHAPRMACATRSVNLSYGVPHSLELTYNQGPRELIALMLLWRQAPANGSLVAEPSCDKSLTFFDNASRPQQAYRDLQSRGWQPVPAANFILPDEAADLDEACNNT